jgi:hypothetical protein
VESVEPTILFQGEPLMLPSCLARSIARLFCLLLLLGCLGCVKAQRSMVLRYDTAKDELHCLHFYANIAGESPDDLAYLQDLWRNRAHVIPQLPFPMGEFQIFGENALLRSGARELLVIPLEARRLRPTGIPTSFDLTAIDIRPGHFFLNDERNLCAYHYVVLPGPAISGLVEINSATLRKTFGADALREVERRRNGGKRPLWNDVRLNMIKQLIASSDAPPMPIKEQPKKDVAPAGPFVAFEDASLRLLLAAVNDNSLTIRRDRMTLSLSMILTETDCRQIQVTFDTYKELLDDEVKAGRDPSGNKKNLLDQVRYWDFKADKDRLTITLDFGAIIKVGFTTANARRFLEAAARAPIDEKTMEKLRIERRNAVATIRGDGVPIDVKMSFDGLFKSFDAGTVPVNRPLDKIGPGTGLFSKSPN